MSSDPPIQDERLLHATLRLNARALALLTGLVCGSALFAATNFLVWKGGPPNEHGDPTVGPHLALLGQYFPGYRMTFVGSLVGFLWAFLVGGLAALLVASIYNRLAHGRDSS